MGRSLAIRPSIVPRIIAARSSHEALCLAGLAVIVPGDEWSVLLYSFSRFAEGSLGSVDSYLIHRTIAAMVTTAR